MNKVNPIKVNIVANEMLKGKSESEAMITAGYSKSTSLQGERNKVVKEAIIQNSTFLEKQGLTREVLIEHLLWGITETKKKCQYSNHSQYCKIIATHLFPTEEATDKNLINIINMYNKNKSPTENVEDGVFQTKSKLT